MLALIKNKATEWVVVVMLLGGVFYAATTAWKNEWKLTAIGEDVKSMKQSIIRLLLEDTPDKSSIIKGLVSDMSFLSGIEKFKSGDFENAYAIWEASALKGNRDSIYAIAVANETLEAKLNQVNVSNEEKDKLLNVLNAAPKVEEKKGVYTISKQDKK